MTGGTGTLGRPVVRYLREAGRDVRVLSRRPGAEVATGDLRTGEGVDAAVAGVTTIVHCATTLGRHDVATTRTLVEAARRAGVPHLVYVSIVGVDRVPMPYYRAKLEAEQVVADSGLPWTILRATQFHELIATMWQVQRFLPVTLTPAGVRVQPIAAAEVAARLAELAGGEPAGRVPDLGGPEVRDAADLARAYLRSVGRRRPVLPLRLPGKAFHGYREGGHLTPAHADGRRTFEEWLLTR